MKKSTPYETSVSSLDEFKEIHTKLFDQYEETGTAIDIKIEGEQKEIINHINQITNNGEGSEIRPYLGESPINNLISIIEKDGNKTIHIGSNFGNL